MAPFAALPALPRGSMLKAHTVRLIAATATAAQVLSACYPRAHEVTDTPAVSGVLLKGGVPASGVRVLISHTRGDNGDFCREARVVAITTEDGGFNVPRNTNSHLFASLFNEQRLVLQTTAVCFEHSAQHQLGVLVLAPTDRETSYSVTCDLDSPPVEFKQHVIWSKDKWGICRNGG